jgi:excisionase family DNA binding protein
MTKPSAGSPRILYPMSQAAYLLGIGRTELYTRLNRGELKSVKLGRLRMIPASELDAFAARLMELPDAS